MIAKSNLKLVCLILTSLDISYPFILSLLRCKVKHRDPKLFYLTMEMRYRRADKSCSIVLEKNSKPAMLQALHPPGESEFHLKIKTGGLIKIFTNSLNTETQYRNLLISEETTSDEVIQLLLNFFNMKEPLEDFSIYQVCPNQEYQRKLHPDDIPLREQQIRISKGDFCHFIIRRAHHRPAVLFVQTDETFNLSLPTTKDICERLQRTSKASNNNNNSNWSSAPIEPPSYSSLALLKSKFNKLESCLSKLTLRNQVTHLADLNEKRYDVNSNILTTDEIQDDQLRRQSRNHKAFSTADISSFSYNPVYNVREIKFTENSF